MKKQIYYIYKLTSPSGRVYVGQTNSINKRFSAYRNLGSNCEKQILLFRSLKKYGWKSFKKEIIIDGIYSEDEISEKEIKLIKYFKSNKKSLNISEDKVYRIKDRKKHPNNIPIYQCDKNGNIIREWCSIAMACDELKISSQSNIAVAIRTKKLKSHGFYWCKQEEYDRDWIKRTINKPHSLSKVVYQLSLDGRKVNEFYNAKQASEHTGIKKGNILGCTCGANHTITAGGYFWIKEVDYSDKNVEKLIQKHSKIKNAKSIFVFDINMNFIKEYRSITETSISLNVAKSVIIRQCKNKVKNPRIKYRFKYGKI